MGAVCVVTVLARGLAAAAQQAGGSTHDEKSTPAPTLDPECIGIHDPTKDEMITVSPPPGPKVMDYNLRQTCDGHVEGKARRQARREPAQTVTGDVIILTWKVGAVDPGVELLQANGAGSVSWIKEGNQLAAGGLAATVSIELLPAIAAIEGVQSIDGVYPPQPAGLACGGRGRRL